MQLGAALSTRLFDDVGAGGTAWLRLVAGGAIFLAIARPRFADYSRHELRVPIALGVITGVMTLAFLSALERIPLGTAVAIEFLGPLGVAVVRAHSRRSLVWPALALAGVVALTEPWTGEVDLLGVAFAAVAAACWAAYILLTQVIGDRFSGLDGLAITIPVAALAASVVGIPQAWGHITPLVLAQAVGLAVLLPVIPFALELARAAPPHHRGVRHADGPRTRDRHGVGDPAARAGAGGAPARRGGARGDRRCRRRAHRSPRAAGAACRPALLTDGGARPHQNSASSLPSMLRRLSRAQDGQ